MLQGVRVVSWRAPNAASGSGCPAWEKIVPHEGSDCAGAGTRKAGQIVPAKITQGVACKLLSEKQDFTQNVPMPRKTKLETGTTGWRLAGVRIPE